jgi:hypothetical protein
MVADPMYEDDTEELLREGLGDAGARGGPGTRAGGRFGAKLTARVLPTREHEEEIELRAPDPEQLVQDVVAHHGRVVRAQPDATGAFAVRGVVGGGALGLNPAVVDVVVRPGGRVAVRAAAKEGLIPQKTAQKAVRRVIESLYSAAPPS